MVPVVTVKEKVEKAEKERKGRKVSDSFEKTQWEIFVGTTILSALGMCPFSSWSWGERYSGC